MSKIITLTFFAGVVCLSGVSSLAVAPNESKASTVTCEVSTQAYVLVPKMPHYRSDPVVSKLVIPIVDVLYFEGGPDWDSKELYRQNAGPYTLYAFSSANELTVFITLIGSKKQLVLASYDPLSFVAGVAFTGVQELITDSSKGSGGIAYKCYKN